MSGEPVRVAIIGGGITGLSAAFYVNKYMSESGRKAEIEVFEAGSGFGGKIHTLERDGIVFEKGPDSFLARKLPMIDLIKELGLEGELVGTNPAAKKTYILQGGRLHSMPPGLVLGIPSKLTPFMKSSLISPLGKLRATLDLALPKKRGTSDESLGHFLERRLGQEVLDRIAEPLLAGIYAGDTRELSLQATFPQFAELERNHRSLIIGTMRTRGQTAPNLPGLPSAAGKSMFLTFRKGLQTIVNALVSALQDSGVKLRPNTAVQSIEKRSQDAASAGGYDLDLENGTRERVAAVIVALPSFGAAAILPDLPAAGFLNRMEYVSVANVVLAFNKKDVNYNFDGSGFVIPRSERRFITACTWTSVKWLHTAPDDKLVLRCYVGRSGEEAWKTMSEAEIVTRVRRDLQEIMGFDAEPLFAEVTPLLRSMPQYKVGHLDDVAAFQDAMARSMPGVVVTGAGFHGVGLPDCVRQGRESAQHVVDLLK